MTVHQVQLFDSIAALASAAENTDLPHAMKWTRQEWYGYKTKEQAIHACHTGDLTLVPKSDEYLAKLEALVPVTKAWRTINNVVGAVPNVPAYLAGNPYNMRLRQRTVSPLAPLSIVLNVASSAGIYTDILHKRGAMLLALVRLLTNVRPVTLYIGTGVHKEGKNKIVMCRADTAPLDLARVAYMLVCSSFSRGLCYGLANAKAHTVGGDGKGVNGDGAEIMRPYIGDNECLFINSMSLFDDIDDEVVWLKNMIGQYGGMEEA